MTSVRCRHVRAASRSAPVSITVCRIAARCQRAEPGFATQHEMLVDVAVGHYRHGIRVPVPALPRKRTSAAHAAMSAKCQ
jgi:hypothetical protein